MKLNNLNKQLRKDKIRVGRGIGSSKGKTCGRGHKGQKSRSGVAIKSFEGGQMPLYRRLPKRGFKSFRKSFSTAIINLHKIQTIIKDDKSISENKINLASLQKAKLINKKYKKLKLLGTGDIDTKFDIEVNFISNSAKEKVEKLGGKVNLLK
jgi:large subunit ribosomal protein L15